MAGFVELFIDKGTDYSSTIELSDTNGVSLNLLNYTANCQIRKSYYSKNAAAIFTCTISDATNGNVTISLTAANTENITPGRYLFDLRLISPANVNTRPLEGIVTITGDISR